jgi:hypothetical protein
MDGMGKSRNSNFAALFPKLIHNFFHRYASGRRKYFFAGASDLKSDEKQAGGSTKAP